MTSADRPRRRGGKLLVSHRSGAIEHLPRAKLGELLSSSDVVVVNDAATLPASLRGRHGPSHEFMEVRLVAWVAAGDPTRFVAIAFGEGDYRNLTEERESPPKLNAGDALQLGPLAATVTRVLDHPRLFALQFLTSPKAVLAGIAQHGRPIQYAYVPKPVAPSDVWTSVAARPVAFEAPSAGVAINWQTVAEWRQRGVSVVSLTHAAGISSTGDDTLDLRLPFDEPYTIPTSTVDEINGTRASRGRVVAVGTTVVRALEAATDAHGTLRAGGGVARNRIDASTDLSIVDAVITGMHQPGESHFDLLQTFVSSRIWSTSSRRPADAATWPMSSVIRCCWIDGSLTNRSLRRDTPSCSHGRSEWSGRSMASSARRFSRRRSSFSGFSMSVNISCSADPPRLFGVPFHAVHLPVSVWRHIAQAGTVRVARSILGVGQYICACFR
jgi:S-adenosylmethionine:tRNA ribosyltransferase-isomerase